MNKIFFLIISYFFLSFGTNLFSEDKNTKLKIGLLAPFTGQYKELGESLLLSTQLALEEIGDENVIVIPKDSGSNNAVILNQSIQEFAADGIRVVIGPIMAKSFVEANKYKKIIFISPSNLSSKIKSNVISIGITLESQLSALENFILKKKKKNTLIIYPNNEYTKLIDSKISKLKLKKYKVFRYNSDPKILTGEIEKLTNYSQRKRNLESRKKILENKEDESSKRELKKLEQIYTLGKVNFDSIIIIDFGSSLKSVLTSLVFSDVNEKNVLFTTVNQWFDRSIFFENSLQTLYYPSVNYKNFQSYNKKYFEIFNTQPSEITILAYDAMGLIYYIWKKNKKIETLKDFIIKDKIKGKIGTFNFKGDELFQELNIYKASNNKFTKF